MAALDRVADCRGGADGARALSAYYNENDPKAAAWLRELIKQGHIAPGDVDERSIEDVLPNELAGYRQCHFFAGIAGWSYALRLAGWPDDRAVWTGSCPCQPFSAAGKGKGFADERHLWPAWFHLVRCLRPELIFGEQVANALPWLDLVSADLESEGYTTGAAVVGAHSVGAPHIRQRLYWVAHNNNNRREGERSLGILNGERATLGDDADGCREDGDWLGDDDEPGLEGRRVPDSECAGGRSAWSPSDFVWCRDGKWRPVEPGTFPLAHGVPERVGLLRGYGNAIVPQVAAAFIEAASGCLVV